MTAAIADAQRSGGDPALQDAGVGREVSRDQIAALVQGDPYLTVDGLHAGYGQMQILHGVDLMVGRKQSLCLIGPNGAGKSTVLHAIFGFNGPQQPLNFTTERYGLFLQGGYKL